MVLDAVKNGDRKYRKGISYKGIKTFILVKYAVNDDKTFLFHCKKALKSVVEQGHVLQKAGVGCSGSFLLAKTKSTLKPKSAQAKPKASGSKPKPKASEIKKKVIKPSPPKAKKPKTVKKVVKKND
jgi:linker histone H1 and H5 family